MHASMLVVEQSALYLRTQTNITPEVGIICGSGLSELSRCMENTCTIKYADIPGFPEATVPGHGKELVLGTINGVQCVCLRGRFHYYEGNTMEQVVLPIRVLRLLGVKLLVVTNAAGGLNPAFNIGDIMVIQDHVGVPGICGNHPLRGLNCDLLGPRFPSISDAYDDHLQDLVIDAAKSLNLEHKIRPDGTYAFVCGPCYESKAEARFLRQLGADTVGASTVPEVIAAKHCGMKILGLSLVTNKVVVGKEQTPAASHAEVLEAVEASGMHVEAIVRRVISKQVIGAYLAVLPTTTYEAPLTCITCKESESCRYRALLLLLANAALAFVYSKY